MIIDVSVDNGGCCETTKLTYHEAPTYIVDKIVHYGVGNIPGAVPRTSTIALTNATIPYIVELANKGWRQACIKSSGLRKGLNIVEGKVLHPGIAEAFNIPYSSVEDLLCGDAAAVANS